MRQNLTLKVPVAHLVGPGKLRVLNGRVAFSRPEHAPLRLDLGGLKTIYCYGPISITNEALRALLMAKVEFALLSAHGNRCHGRLVGPRDSATWLRIQQHRVLADPCRCLELARRTVLAKIESQQQAARHYQRQGCRAAGPVLKSLQRLAASAGQAASLEALRGFEGGAGAAWFDLLASLLRAPWTFPGRRRRPPTDPVNALLSLGYTLLNQRFVAGLQAAGLEVNLGALHQYHPGRPSLACDLMEPLRIPAVDRWVVRLCNLGELATADFESHPPSQAVRLRQARFGRTLANWEQHLRNNDLDSQIQAGIEAFCQLVRQLSTKPPTSATRPETGQVQATTQTATSGGFRP